MSYQRKNKGSLGHNDKLGIWLGVRKQRIYQSRCKEKSQRVPRESCRKSRRENGKTQRADHSIILGGIQHGIVRG